MPRIRTLAVLAVSLFSAAAVVQAREKIWLRAQDKLLVRIASEGRASEL
jgi:hypothetical protein